MTAKILFQDCHGDFVARIRGDGKAHLRGLFDSKM